MHWHSDKWVQFTQLVVSVTRHYLHQSNIAHRQWINLSINLLNAESVSEYIINSTSAQLGYKFTLTVPFTLIHTGKYTDRRKTKHADNRPTKTKHSPEKQTMQNTEKNYVSLVEFNDTICNQRLYILKWASSKPISTGLLCFTRCSAVILTRIL